MRRVIGWTTAIVMVWELVIIDLCWRASENAVF